MDGKVKTIDDLLKDWRHVTPWIQLWPRDVREKLGVWAVGIAPATSKAEKAVQSAKGDDAAHGNKTLSGMTG